MVNKYGNDFKNNIFWNKEYPFIPEITNDSGFTIHEGDIVDFYDRFHKDYRPARVYKIYDKNHIWTGIWSPENDHCEFDQKANNLFPHKSKHKIPPLRDFDNQGIFNPLEDFLGGVYSDIYPEELNEEGDWHFDKDKFNAKRLEEVAKLKNKY